MEDKALRVPGAKVEHNKYCVTLHFRRVKEEVSSMTRDFLSHFVLGVSEDSAHESAVICDMLSVRKYDLSLER